MTSGIAKDAEYVFAVDFSRFIAKVVEEFTIQPRNRFILARSSSTPLFISVHTPERRRAAS